MQFLALLFWLTAFVLQFSFRKQITEESEKAYGAYYKSSKIRKLIMVLHISGLLLLATSFFIDVVWK